MKGRQVLSDLRSVEDSLQSLARDLRQFCNELRPPSLGSFGLESGIHSLVDTLSARYPGLEFELDLDDEGLRLDPEVRLGLFRVCQELLNNAARHAKASQVRVTLRMEEHQVVLEVSDNGEGFAIPGQWVDLAREGHLGLVGVQERVDAVGGSLEIQSAAETGTRVRVAVAFPGEPAAAP